MNILRISALLLTAAFVQGCASFGHECHDCCERPTLAQAQQIQPPPCFPQLIANLRVLPVQIVGAKVVWRHHPRRW